MKPLTDLDLEGNLKIGGPLRGRGCVSQNSFFIFHYTAIHFAAHDPRQSISLVSGDTCIRHDWGLMDRKYPCCGQLLLGSMYVCSQTYAYSGIAVGYSHVGAMPLAGDTCDMATVVP